MIITNPLSRSIESILCDVLRGGIVFKGGAAIKVSGIVVWFVLKLKKLTSRAIAFLNSWSGSSCGKFILPQNCRRAEDLCASVFQWHKTNAELFVNEWVKKINFNMDGLETLRYALKLKINDQ